MWHVCHVFLLGYIVIFQKEFSGRNSMPANSLLVCFQPPVNAVIHRQFTPCFSGVTSPAKEPRFCTNTCVGCSILVLMACLHSDPAKVCRSQVIKPPMVTSCLLSLWEDCHRLLCLNVGPPNLLHLLCAQLTAMVSVLGYMMYLTRTSSIQWYVSEQVQSTRKSYSAVLPPGQRVVLEAPVKPVVWVGTRC